MRQRWAGVHVNESGQPREGDMCSINLGVMVGRGAWGFAELNEPLNAEFRRMRGERMR